MKRRTWVKTGVRSKGNLLQSIVIFVQGITHEMNNSIACTVLTIADNEVWLEQWRAQQAMLETFFQPQTWSNGDTSDSDGYESEPENDVLWLSRAVVAQIRQDAYSVADTSLAGNTKKTEADDKNDNDDPTSATTAPIATKIATASNDQTSTPK